MNNATTIPLEGVSYIRNVNATQSFAKGSTGALLLPDQVRIDSWLLKSRKVNSQVLKDTDKTFLMMFSDSFVLSDFSFSTPRLNYA